MLAEPIAPFLVQYVGKDTYVTLSFTILLAGPVVFGALLISLLFSRHRGVRAGGVWGVFVAAWASGCWLTMPYIGGYANLLALTIMELTVLSRPPIDRWYEEALVYVVNFTLWPAIGVLLLMVKFWLFGLGHRGTP